MSILADIVAITHGLILIPLLMIGSVFIIFSRQKIIWLEALLVTAGALTILSFLITGGCILTDLEKYLLTRAGEPVYESGFVRHYLGQIGINWSDAMTGPILTVVLVIAGAKIIARSRKISPIN